MGEWNAEAAEWYAERYGEHATNRLALEPLEVPPGENRIEFELGRATEIPIEDDRADFVFAFDSFDYWSDPAAGLVEVARVLAAGGRFIALKDAGDPNAGESGEAFLEAVSASPLRVLEERELREGEVGCTWWMCAPR